MPKLKEKPEVRTSKSGAHYMEPADIINSEAGRRAIRKMNALFAVQDSGEQHNGSWVRGSRGHSSKGAKR